jgi:hypothetical protein
MTGQQGTVGAGQSTTSGQGAALLPIGRLAVGRWAGLTAIVLCLLTGYFYGSLFFTPIDVPFVVAMTMESEFSQGLRAFGYACR